MQFDQLKRREFITLGAASVCMPPAVFAQEPGRVYRIGFLSGAPREWAMYTAFFEELRRSGLPRSRHRTMLPLPLSGPTTQAGASCPGVALERFAIRDLQGNPS